FLTACGCATAGQIVESMVLNRACLENAAYGLHIFAQPGLNFIWLNRNQTESDLKEMKKEFTNGKLRKTIEKYDRGLVQVYDHLYEGSIDFGGHPNQRGVVGSMRVTHDQDKALVTNVYLQGEGLSLYHTLKTSAQTGICALRLLQFTMQPKFELLGVRAGIEQAQ